MITNAEIKAILYRLINIVDYYERVASLPDCNDCGGRNMCMYAPKPGQQVRINCPLWRPENGSQKKGG